MGTTCAVLRNNCRATNTPPAAPVGLTATLLPENDVRLGWAGATDGQTAAAGLHYNLRVGTNSGGQQIQAPHSDPETGWRRLPGRGNAGPATAWLLRDLPRGTYYWGVQAIDPAFAGAPPAAEATFTITNARPTISGDQSTAVTS